MTTLRNLADYAYGGDEYYPIANLLVKDAERELGIRPDQEFIFTNPPRSMNPILTRWADEGEPFYIIYSEGIDIIDTTGKIYVLV
jgi:hypothetical protein